MGRQPETSEEKAAAQLVDSARRIVAGWADDPLVRLHVAEFRPGFRELLDRIGIDDPGERAEASVRILGISPVLPDGTEEPNPFAGWSPERLAPARRVASAARAGLAALAASLRGAGVTALAPVEQVSPDSDAPDGLSFGFVHAALLMLLWLDIPLDGRSGAAIAAALPMLGTVGWERDRSNLLVGAASQPDILAGDTLRRAFLRHVVEARVTDSAADAPSALPLSTVPMDFPAARSASAAESAPKGRARPRKPRPGRPPGTRYLSRSVVLLALRDLNVDAAAGRLKTRDGRLRRYVTMQDLADRVEAPLGTLKDFLRANRLYWPDRSAWPLE